MDIRDELEVEHYRYVISRIASTNDNTLKIVSAFSAVATLIVTGLVTIGLSFRQLGVEAAQAHQYASTLLALLVLATALTIVVMLVNAAAWYQYRKEETRMLRAHGVDREPPSLWSMYRWIETYIALITITTTVAIDLIAISQLLPSIK